MARHNAGPRNSIQLRRAKLEVREMRTPKPKPVTDADLAAAALAWGRAWIACMYGGGTFADVEIAHGNLYQLALRAAQEREVTDDEET